ncbi:MAG: MogA/MoaB family molybdenum cofactor biosynthesis protein [Planctomycetota bacterium]|nr:MogA/MoaB family molybdenum cofactor biosynthesis protein [Planctomycetota bacterium]
MAYEDHKQSAATIRARCAVITVSDTRTCDTDTSGLRISQLLQADGHDVAFHQIIADDPARLDALLTELENHSDIDVILTNGGTGISRRDNTVPVIARHLSTPLPGFGELFRTLSCQEIQSGAMLSRALGGIANGKLLFAMPGSTSAVELAMTRLILPELRHLLAELRR